MALTYTKANALLATMNSNVWMGLSTTTPARDGSNVTEPSASAGYCRKQIRSGQMSTPSNGVTQNVETLYFSEATGDWGTCTYFCLFSGETGNNLIAFGELTASIHPTSGKVPLIRYDSSTHTGQFSMTM